PQVSEDRGDPPPVLQPAPDRQALFIEGPRALQLPVESGQPTGRAQSPCAPGRGGRALRQCQQEPKLVPSFPLVAPRLPEPLQRAPQSQPQLRLSALDRPGERRAQVV